MTGDAFFCEITQEVMDDDGEQTPEVYRMRWLRSLIAIVGVMTYVGRGTLRDMRRTWPYKEVIERELGEWQPDAAAEVWKAQAQPKGCRTRRTQ